MMSKQHRPQRKYMAAKRLAINAVLIAIYVVLRFFSIPVGDYFRITLAAFSVILCALIYGPVDGLIVGFLGEFLSQILGPYGLTPTTLIWCVGETVRGGMLGLCSLLFLRKGLLRAGKVQAKYTVLTLLCCVVTSVLAALGQTLALYVDSKMFGYYTYVMVFGVMIWRILIYALLAGAFGYVSIPIISALKKARLIGKEHAMTAKEAVEYIHSITWMGSKPGLERTCELLKKMGNPHHKLKFIHIAGTNGKGSTTAMTASILQKAGYRVGMFTSPCIYKFNERIQVNGENISDKDLAEITAFVKPLAAAMEDHPSEFELVSCIGFEYFLRQKCDIVVLEVGMGGALDSTNVIPVPEVAVLTNIGLDHTDFLGNTLEEIAETKAGIFKEGGDAVLYPAVPSVEATVERICKERNMRLHKADFRLLTGKSRSLEGQTFDYGNRKDLELPLLGDHQLHNAAVVLTIVDVLKGKGWNIEEEHIREGLRVVTWPGRFQIMRRDPLFIIDGGHNPQCIEALVKNVEDYLAGRRIVVLSGVLADKDYGQMYVPVMPFVEEFVCITPPSPRKLEAVELAKHLQANGAKATPCDTISEGVRLAVEKAGEDGVVLCFGSLYTIGSIKEALDAL